jgi:hypothetical protein
MLNYECRMLKPGFFKLVAENGFRKDSVFCQGHVGQEMLNLTAKDAKCQGHLPTQSR